jgi:hypothetical protein
LDVSAPSHDEAPASLRADGAHDAGERRLTGKARNLFRAGARPTFFVAKKVGKENSLRPIQICQRIFGQDFSTRHPCLVEKRRTSCPSPSGSPIPERCARPSTSPGLIERHEGPRQRHGVIHRWRSRTGRGFRTLSTTTYSAKQHLFNQQSSCLATIHLQTVQGASRICRPN